MLRFFLIAILSCLSFCYTNAQSSKDSSRKRFADKLISKLAGNCVLIDSSKQKLSNFVNAYLIEIIKVRESNTDKLICTQKISELRSSFANGLKEKFGNCVYKNYKQTSGDHYPDRSPNRIPRRTSE